MLGVAGVVQLMASPPEAVLRVWLGASWPQCPVRILALALPALLALLLGPRRLAPTAATAAGLLAGGLAATVYGSTALRPAPPSW